MNAQWFIKLDGAEALEVAEEMYEALSGLLDECENGAVDPDRLSMKAARAALAKAEGK